MQYVLDTLDRAKRYFASRRLAVASYDDRPALSVSIPTEQALFQAVFEVDHQGRVATVRLLWGARCPLAGTPRMATYLAQRNFGLRAGRFEMDVSTGDIFFCAGQYLGGKPMSQRLISELVETSSTLFSSEIPGLMEVMMQVTRSEQRRQNRRSRTSPNSYPRGWRDVYDNLPLSLLRSPFPELEVEPEVSLNAELPLEFRWESDGEGDAE